MQSVYLTLSCVFLALSLSSCPADNCPPDDDIKLFISNGQRIIAYPYSHAYGLGKSGQIIENNDRTSGDTGFYLPLDVNSNSCGFFFFRKDGSSDTAIFNYKMKHILVDKCGLLYQTDDFELNYLSSRFYRDSLRPLYKYYKNTFVLTLK
ncbi:MAG: hypothetical protein R2852_03170 [Bacteroidia bacterium]